MSAEIPPAEDGWIHEVKHDGHRLSVISDGRGRLRFISRNGFDRSGYFAGAVTDLSKLSQAAVLDGEIASPDERGVTRISALQEAMTGKRTDQLVFFAFDLLHLGRHDLRACTLVDRKAMLANLLSKAGLARVVFVDHVERDASRMLEAIRQLGAEGIVSKRAVGKYRAGRSRQWLKIKCHETRQFVVTGFLKPRSQPLEALLVAEVIGTKLEPAGSVRFGLAGRRLFELLGDSAIQTRGAVITVRPEFIATAKFFGRHRNGSIRDGVLLSIEKLR